MRINKAKNIIVLISCFMFNQVLADLLENGALDQINNSAVVGISGLNLDYKEIFFDSDKRSNGVLPKSTEAGTILGVYFNPRAAFLNNTIYTDLYLDYYDGKLKYDGSRDENVYQNGILIATNSVPVEGKFCHKFFNANFKSGYIFTFFENHSFQAIPYVGVGYRYWKRTSDALNYESYHHYKAIAGIKFNWLLTDNFVVSPYAEGGRIFSAKMKIPYYDRSYTLGKKPIYETGIELNYRIFDEFFLNGIASYTQFKYGKSDSSSNGSYEPDSKTNELKFGLGIRYSWLIN